MIEDRFAVFTPRKFTRFDETGGTNAFEVAANEVVYIGTIRAQLGTKLGTLRKRLLWDARRSYVKDTIRARWALAQFGLAQYPLPDRRYLCCETQCAPATDHALVGPPDR